MTESQPQQAQWKLIRIEGADVAESVLLSGETTRIGRDLDNDITVNDLQVSRHHALITQDNGQISIEDLGSVNGVTVNGAPVTEPLRLQPGDVINIGAATFQIQREAVNISQTRTPTQVSLPPPETPLNKSLPILLIVAAVLFTVVIVLAVVVAGMWIFSSTAPTPTAVAENAGSLRNSAQMIVNQAPGGNSPTFVNQSITVQITAMDPAGITRMELWANGRKVDEVTSPLDQNATSMTASFQWTPSLANSYALEVRSFNDNGISAITELATLTVLGGTFTPTPTAASTSTPTSTPMPVQPTPLPTLTPTPLPPTPTRARAILFVNTARLNVRSGPGTQYDLVGQLEQGDGVEVIGQATGVEGILWWQIPYRETPAGVGWVQANPDYVRVFNTDYVAVVDTPAPATATPTPLPVPTDVPPTDTPTPTLTPTPQNVVIRAPEGKMLLIASNRSLGNQPARLTISGGKSVGGGRELDPPPGGEIQIELEPDSYRALWSSPPNHFARGSDFEAVAGNIMVMWAVPEAGRTETEIYDEIVVGETQSAPEDPTASGDDGPPPGKALFVVANRSLANEYALLTIAGGNFGGGQEIIMNANTETQLELLPGEYRTIWNTPASGGMNAGKEFTVTAGETIYGWIIPENGQAFMEFPGQPVTQINN